MTGTFDPAAGRNAQALPLATVEEWLGVLCGRGEIGRLLSPPWEEQLGLGYGHTLREIAQQPVTWLETTSRLRGERPPLGECLRDVQAIVFTGSGSSVYAAECVAPWLQAATDLPACAVPAGSILTHPESCLPPSGRFLVVSVARSGDSPESRAVVDWLLESRPQA
ncbi:MAG TPA: hypothetical protein VEQ10_12755, partial [Vicinamibacteria bacterium]|nr:hypothetical protein [Vicinamibacteria bacterium]